MRDTKKNEEGRRERARKKERVTMQATTYVEHVRGERRREGMKAVHFLLIFI